MKFKPYRHTVDDYIQFLKHAQETWKTNICMFLTYYHLFFVIIKHASSRQKIRSVRVDSGCLEASQVLQHARNLYFLTWYLTYTTIYKCHGVPTSSKLWHLLSRGSVVPNLLSWVSKPKIRSSPSGPVQRRIKLDSIFFWIETLLILSPNQESQLYSSKSAREFFISVQYSPQKD